MRPKKRYEPQDCVGLLLAVCLDECSTELSCCCLISLLMPSARPILSSHCTAIVHKLSTLVQLAKDKIDRAIASLEASWQAGDGNQASEKPAEELKMPSIEECSEELSTSQPSRGHNDSSH